MANSQNGGFHLSQGFIFPHRIPDLLLTEAEMNHAAIGRCRSCWFLSQVSLWLEALGHCRNIHIFLHIFWFGTAPKVTNIPWKSMIGEWNFLVEMLPFLGGGRVNFRWGKSALPLLPAKKVLSQVINSTRIVPCAQPSFQPHCRRWSHNLTIPWFFHSYQQIDSDFLHNNSTIFTAKVGSFQPRKHPVWKKNRRLKLKQTTANNSVLVPRKLAEICFFGRREADVSHLHWGGGLAGVGFDWGPCISAISIVSTFTWSDQPLHLIIASRPGGQCSFARPRFVYSCSSSPSSQSMAFFPSISACLCTSVWSRQRPDRSSRGSIFASGWTRLSHFGHNLCTTEAWSWAGGTASEADLQRDKTENLPQTRSWSLLSAAGCTEALVHTKVSWLLVVWTFSRSLESLNTSESQSRAWLKPTPKASLQGQLVFPWSAGTAPCPACAATDDTRLGLPMVGELWPAGAGYGHLNGYAISHCTPGCGALSLVQITSSRCLIHPCLKGMPQCALTDSCTQILVTYHRLWEAHRICRLDKCNPGKVN